MQYSLYLHIPFCGHRCAYCDFNTYAGQESRIPTYASALCREIEFVGSRAPGEATVHTVYLGGGTPSLLSAEQLGLILGTIREAFELEGDAEVSFEANPGTVSAEGLHELRRHGFNRVSFGVQSANGEELRMLERQHSYLDVLEAVSAARRAGFENINVDLIYGLPAQTLHAWQTTVQRVLELNSEHVSAYALTLEHGTPFGRWSSRGLLPTPDPDLAADMYDWLSAELTRAGYEQYEISNWARPGMACRHNLQYWRGKPYLGFGAGAHGYANGFRYSNVLRIATYAERLNRPVAGASTSRRVLAATQKMSEFEPAFPFSPAVVNQHRQAPQDEMSEFMITGLRLTREGISAEQFRGRFGTDILDQYGRQVAHLVERGLLEWAPPSSPSLPTEDTAPNDSLPDVLRLTARGRLLGNQVFMQFLA